MPIRKYDGTIVHTGKDCTISFANEAFVYGDLKNAFTDGAKVTVEIKSRRKARSIDQNAYMHMAFQIIADETGNSADVVKNTMKALYAKKPMLDKDGNEIFNKVTGEQAMYIQDTRDMSTIENMEFMDNVRLFAAEFLGCDIPLPDQNLKINFK